MIDVRTHDAVTRISLDAADRGNTVDYPALDELLTALEQAAADATVRAVCLDGRGPDFCRGERRGAMGDWPARFAARRHAGPDSESPVVQQAVLSALWRMPKPTMVVLTGTTAGFGFDLACAADLRMAVTGARVGDGRILQGEDTGTGTSYRLPRLIGLSQASRLLLLGAELDAAEALRIGLVHEVVEADELAAHVDAKVAAVAAMATRAYALIKEQLLVQLDLPYDVALLHSLGLRQTNVIEDRAEGALSFREKRPPRFTGR